MARGDATRTLLGPVAASVLVCALALALGFAFKMCPGFEDTGLEFACHTDVTALYSARDIDSLTFPYLGGRLEGDREGGALTGYDLRLLDGANEYPVVTGVLMWAVGIPVSTPEGYLVASALVMAPMGLFTALLLARMSAWRALLWSASPALILYAFHNWELPVIAAATAGCWAWWRGHPFVAAAAFGLGAGLKLYPALFVLPLVHDRWVAGDRREAVSIGGVALGVFTVLNLPIALASPSGWWISFRFHQLRPANYDSIWGAHRRLYELGPATVGLVTTVLIAISTIVVLLVVHRRRQAEGVYPFIQACAAILAVFLLWNKVHSPQYALWLVPFLVMLRLHVGWWLALMLSTVLVYVGVFVLGQYSVDLLRTVVPLAVTARAVLIAALAVAFLRAAPAFPAGDEIERSTT